MPTLLWAFACQTLITDKASGLASAINILEQFGLPSEAFPGEVEPTTVAVNPLLHLVMLLSWEWPENSSEESAIIQVSLDTPRKSSAVLVESGIVHKEGKKRTRLTIGIGALPIDVPGTYIFRIEINESTAFRLPIDILENKK